jgi:chromosome segregation ATPase
MNKPPNTTPLRDDLHESRYSRLQTQFDLAQRIIRHQAEALQATDAEMQRALAAERTLIDDVAALTAKVDTQADSIGAYQLAIAASEASRDRLHKDNADLSAKLKTADYVSPHDDDKTAWRTLEAFWVAVFVACIVVAIKSCGVAA